MRLMLRSILAAIVADFARPRSVRHAAGSSPPWRAGGFGALFLHLGCYSQQTIALGLSASALFLAQPARAADCSISPSGTTQTYTYTSSNLQDTAAIQFPLTLTCSSSSDGRSVCAGSQYAGYAAGPNGQSLFMRVLFQDQTHGSATSTLATNGAMVGPYGPGGTGATTTNLMVTARVPSYTVGSLPPGTYTATFPVHIDMATGSSCDSYTANTVDSATASYTVNYVVPPNAKVSLPFSLNFGNISAVTVSTSTDITTSGDLFIASNTPYTVYLGDGAGRTSPGSGLRSMKNGTDKLAYQLYKDSAFQNVWDETGGPTTIGGSGGLSGSNPTAQALIDLPIYAKIPAGTQLPKPGVYSDTVIITIAY